MNTAANKPIEWQVWVSKSNLKLAVSYDQSEAMKLARTLAIALEIRCRIVPVKTC